MHEWITCGTCKGRKRIPDTTVTLPWKRCPTCYGEGGWWGRAEFSADMLDPIALRAKIIDKWVDRHESEHGHYAALVGFETELKKNDKLAEVYEKLNVYEQIALFGFVFDLLVSQTSTNGTKMGPYKTLADAKKKAEP